MVTFSTNDNRAFQPSDVPPPLVNPNGGLVDLTVPLGEPDSVSLFASPLVLPSGDQFPTGFPTCAADLAAQSVSCTGLVDGDTYSLTDGGQNVSGAADPSGTLTNSMTLHRGDTVVLKTARRGR